MERVRRVRRKVAIRNNLREGKARKTEISLKKRNDSLAKWKDSTCTNSLMGYTSVSITDFLAGRA